MKSLIALMMSLVLTGPVIAADRVQGVLDALRAEHGFPGASVAWTGPDGAVHVRTTGFADPEAALPMTAETRMLAASIGKSYVAATALALEADGQLDLDAPVSDLLGERAWFARLPNHDRLTLRHLLNHSGGLPDHVELPAFQGLFLSRGPDDPVPVPEDLIGLILDAPPLFPAGAGWAYSDTGYLLAGLVIEAAAGQPWGEVVRDRFLLPLGLTDTEPSDQRVLDRLATGFTSMAGPVMRTLDPEGRLIFHPGIEGAGGGFVTTATDLALWGRLLLSGRAMETEYLDAMLQGIDTGAPGRSYGLGVGIDRTGAEEVRGHGGWIPGYVGSLRYYPARDVAIAIQINSDVGMLGEQGAVDGIERAIHEEILKIVE
ncbi:serine hydrolase [Roseinatronobacter sp. S2]|uniref:serine hydrolase domain-containing protein n=1 Tax=Roseinatronobacter sp. S2 TaxID=3035471 RepID=UPI00240F97DE|nr:serine hydrolase domain-containing protein [Roseinatronobacter sp. S2]WFE75198.1 serine hydrolase [Roseinatronobacter sp. S2]